MASARSIVRIFGLRCREAAELLSSAEDGELSRPDRWALRVHLITCRACRRLRTQFAAIRELLNGLDTQYRGEAADSGATLSDDARRRLERIVRSPDEA